MDHRTFAVLVGIDDYSALDRSLDLPHGTSDNAGAVYDAEEWFHLFRGLGAADGDLVLLTAAVADAPRPMRGTKRAGARGEPNRENVLAAAAWLRSQLLRTPRSRGMFVYSGHGEVDARGVATLCTADAAWRGGELEGVVSVDELVEALGGRATENRLTLVLDTCHAGATGAVGPDRARRARRPAGAPARPVEARPFPFPTLVACGPTERSYELPVGRVWRGAFSWSLLRVVQRWGLTTAGAEIAFGELIARSSAMLAAMGVDQTPAYRGPPKLDGAALFLRRRAEGGPMALGDREIDAGAYDLRSPTGDETYGQLYASGEDPADGLSDHTVWWWGPDPGGNPLVTRDVFDLVRAAYVLAAPPASPWMVHANGVFTPFAPGTPIPYAPRWYRWSRRPAAGGAPVTQGWLGVRPGAQGVPWQLTWLSAHPLQGRAKLATDETFRFERVPGPPPPGVPIHAVSTDTFLMP